ncbi:MAG: hypothetical protein Q9187_004090 [Circinaria calcarea]
MLPTPSTTHVDTNCIYEPAEDSFLLLDTLSSTSETQFLKQRFNSNRSIDTDDRLNSPSPLILEVGTGSGVVLAFITAHAETLFGRPDVLTLGADINPFACQATEETIRRACKERAGVGKEYGACLGVMNSDLATAVRPGMVDMLVFNPPYVPTSPLTWDYESDLDRTSLNLDSSNQKNLEDSRLLSLSYAGGIDGMEVADRLLEQIPSLLTKDRGVAYILLCRQNKPDDVMRRVRTWGLNMSAETVKQSGKTSGWEKLQVIRIWCT